MNIFVFVFGISDCVSISAFASLVDVPVDTASSTVGINICAITAGIKKYKSIIKKKRRKHDKILLLGKDKLDTIDGFNRRVYCSHDFFSVNNVLRVYNKMKEEIKNPQNVVKYII